MATLEKTAIWSSVLGTVLQLSANTRGRQSRNCSNFRKIRITQNVCYDVYVANINWLKLEYVFVKTEQLLTLAKIRIKTAQGNNYYCCCAPFESLCRYVSCHINTTYGSWTRDALITVSHWYRRTTK